MATLLAPPASGPRPCGDRRERIGIVGTGIAGLTAASLLHEAFDITVFECSDWIGGHSHTVYVQQDGCPFAVDTGFIVYNEHTYPNFTRMLSRLRVPTRETSMSFSVRDDAAGLEYASANMNAIFAQRSNLLSPRFLRMLREIVRFNQEAHRFLDSGDDTTTLVELLAQLGFSTTFNQHYLTPMLAAIWSADPSKVGEFPARHFLRFFDNHGLITLGERPQWRTICGGSREYVRRLIAPFSDRILVSQPVLRVERTGAGVRVVSQGATHEFDRVVLAVHSDDALRLLNQPTRAERDALGAMPYQSNDVVLHTDTAVLPRHRRAWASWNYRVPPAAASLPTLTYNMNILQGIESRSPFLVTLNDTASIRPECILGRWPYSHPFYSRDSIAAQSRHDEISGADRVYFCGAYWGYGFHEDGVRSALAVARQIGAPALV